MKSHRRKPRLVAPDSPIDVLGMVMQHDREKVATLREALVSRLVDMEVQALGRGAVPTKKARYVPRQSDTYGAYRPFSWIGLSHMEPWFSRSLRQTREQVIQAAG